MITAEINKDDNLIIYLTGERQTFDGYSKAKLEFKYDNPEAASINVEIFLPGLLNVQSSMTIQFGTMVYAHFLKRWADEIESFYQTGNPIEFFDATQDLTITFPQSPSARSAFPIWIKYEHVEFGFEEDEANDDAHFMTKSFVGHRENILSVSEVINQFIENNGMITKLR